MTAQPWHAGPALLARYAAGTLDHVAQAAIESHVTSCPSCRAEAAGLLSGNGLDPVWTRVATSVSAPPLPAPLRWLARLGVSDGDLVVIRNSLGIHVPWVLAVLSSFVFAVAASHLAATQRQTWFLLVVPLLPVLLVGAAYGTTERLRALVEVTPFSKLRITLLRTAVALVAALPVVAFMGLLVPGLGAQRAAWLLPSLTLTLAALTLLRWLPAATAVAGMCAVWAIAVIMLRSKDELAAITTAQAQLSFAAAAAILAAAFAASHSTLRVFGGRT